MHNWELGHFDGDGFPSPHWDIACTTCNVGLNFTSYSSRHFLPKTWAQIADFMADVEMTVTCPWDGKPKEAVNA